MYTDVHIEGIIIRVPWDEYKHYLVNSKGEITDTFSGSFGGILEREDKKREEENET